MGPTRTMCHASRDWEGRDPQVHPAARILVDISKAQDNEVGDCTTSVVVITGTLG